MSDDISDADALAALRRIAAQIEEMDDFVLAVEDGSDVTATLSKANHQASDPPLKLQSLGDRLPA